MRQALFSLSSVPKPTAAGSRRPGPASRTLRAASRAARRGPLLDQGPARRERLAKGFAASSSPSEARPCDKPLEATERCPDAGSRRERSETAQRRETALRPCPGGVTLAKRVWLLRRGYQDLEIREFILKPSSRHRNHGSGSCQRWRPMPKRRWRRHTRHLTTKETKVKKGNAKIKSSASQFSAV